MHSFVLEGTFVLLIVVRDSVLHVLFGPGIRGTQVKSSVRMKKT